MCTFLITSSKEWTTAGIAPRAYNSSCAHRMGSCAATRTNGRSRGPLGARSTSLAGGGLAQAEPTGESSASFKARHDVLMFRTQPLPEPLEITGPAALKLFASSTTDDADLFVTMHLFDPHGDEVLLVTAIDPKSPVAQGWLRMSHRALDPVRSLPYRPWHPHDRVDPLEPGHTYEADVEIWPTSIIAPAGYSLGVSVRGVDYAHSSAGNLPVTTAGNCLAAVRTGMSTPATATGQRSTASRP